MEAPAAGIKGRPVPPPLKSIDEPTVTWGDRPAQQEKEEEEDDCSAELSYDAWNSLRNSETDVNVNMLIENEVSKAMVRRASFSSSDWGGGFDYEKFIYSIEAEAAIGTEGAERPPRPSQLSMGSCRSLMSGADSELAGSTGTDRSDFRPEKELLRNLFAPKPGAQPREPEKHRALSRVIGNIFTEFRMDENMCNRSSWSVSGYYVGNETIGARARRMASHAGFIGFFLILTLYALFAPDMLHAWGTKELEHPFRIASTVVFFLFCSEILVCMLDERPYVRTAIFILDVLALLSFFMETWFVHKDASILDDQSSLLAQLVRSTRLTRLARIARIARVTRIIPAVITLCLQHKVRLARVMILRRIWRAFVFLDSDRDRLVSYYDLKFFYVSVLYRFRQSVSVYMHLREDTRFFLEAETNGSITLLDFREFSRLFMATSLGKEMMKFQLADLERTAGIWVLIRKVSDRSALKVSVGILILLSVLQVFSIDRADTSARQDLSQLEVMSREPSYGVAPGSEALCAHLALYARMHRPLLILLHGRLVWNEGSCLFGEDAALVAPAEALQVLLAKFAASTLRVSEATPLCGSRIECSAASEHSTVVLLDHSELLREESAWSVVGMVSTLTLLLIYILILNGKITRFSKTLLMPLRALVDDMVALSSLELADIDEDLPAEIARRVVPDIHVSEDVLRLQESFKTMRSAVRSWCKYVPLSVVQRLFVAGLEARIGVVKCTATIMFCDVDGFEALCDGLDPAEVLDLISAITGTAAEVIHKNEGTLLEFIGDEVLAVFNTPRVQKNHVQLGVVTALQIHQAIAKLTYRTLYGHKHLDLRCRCGVHTASIFAGNIGSYQRMKYGLLGDGINLTARLKGLNSRYKTHTMVSASVHDVFAKRKTRHVLLRAVDLVAVKGKKEPSIVYESILSGSVTVKAAFGKHNDGFRLYQQRSFAEAADAFREAANILGASASSDVPSLMLAQRCEAYMACPPPADWDGVERMTKKSFDDPPPQEGLGDIAWRTSGTARPSSGPRTSARSCS